MHMATDAHSEHVIIIFFHVNNGHSNAALDNVRRHCLCFTQSPLNFYNFILFTLSFSICGLKRAFFYRSCVTGEHKTLVARETRTRGKAKMAFCP